MTTDEASAEVVTTDPFDATRAPANIDATIRERSLPFCRDPHRPLSPAARTLCSHAVHIPDCAGFAAACEQDDTASWSFWRWLAKATQGLAPGPVKSLLAVLARLPAIMFLALVMAILGAALLVIVRSVRRLHLEAPLRRKTPSAPRDAAISELLETNDAEAFLAAADGCARRGDNDMALQLYLAASLSALDRRGAVRCARHRTNGEYCRSCAEEPSRAPLREVVREADRAKFGGVPSTPTVVARTAQLATGIVRWLPVAALIFALPESAACSVWTPHRAGDDPAGAELFGDLLKRQGAVVEPLDEPILDLSPAKSGGPAVVVDFDTTELDDDTQAHLVAWVRGGGILVAVGSARAWPAILGGNPRRTDAHVVWASPLTRDPKSPLPVRAELAAPAAFDIDLRKADEAADSEIEDDDDGALSADAAATFEDANGVGPTYAASWSLGRGRVLGMATDELLTNAGLARPGNAAALLAILSHADRTVFRIAAPEDGMRGPSSPIAALIRAGLGLALAHGAAAALLLFVAVGVRLRSPQPALPSPRRAFVEHVEAVGAMYARTGSARHALSAYARFAETRLRARVPRGAVASASLLAARARLPRDVCERLLPGTAPACSIYKFDAKNQSSRSDLMLLKELRAEVAAATAQDDRKRWTQQALHVAIRG
jgi:hypothetical protein